jgi:hypothetical protein
MAESSHSQQHQQQDQHNHPSILDKVSPKTRGYLIQAHQHRLQKEQEQQQQSNMSGEQT